MQSNVELVSDTKDINMSKTVIIGDVHGRTDWEKIVAKENGFDKFVFIGDYFDNFPPMKQEQIISNFKNILTFKKEYPQEVVLLIGNHDFHYTSFSEETYSGYNKKFAPFISKLIHDALHEGLMQMCYTQNNVVCTHAGITKTWLEDSGIDTSDGLEVAINNAFRTQPQLFRFARHDPTDHSGESKHQSPIWVRPNSLRRDGIEGVLQIVGHTTMPYVQASGDFVFIDAPNSKEYLVIEDDLVTINQWG